MKYTHIAVLISIIFLSAFVPVTAVAQIESLDGVQFTAPARSVAAP